MFHVKQWLSLCRSCRGEINLQLLTRTLINNKVLPFMLRRCTYFCPQRAKSSKNAFAAVFRRLVKTESINQRKVGFHPHAHRRQLESFILSPSKCKRFTICHIFSFAVVCSCRGVGFIWFFGFCSLFFSLYITASQAVILSRFYKLVCGMKTDVSAAGNLQLFITAAWCVSCLQIQSVAGNYIYFSL